MTGRERTRQKRQKNPRELCIRMLLSARGVTLTDLARRCGSSQSYISMIVAGQRRSARIERRIGSLLGLGASFFAEAQDASQERSFVGTVR